MKALKNVLHLFLIICVAALAQDNGRKLIVTMTILNVTKKYELGKDKSYRCVANAVNISRPAQFVFSIFVIQESDIPKVTVSNLTVDHSVPATIFCNITFRGSQTTTLKSLWLSKDGENLTDTLKEDGISESTSLVLKNISMKDGGMYSCNLKVLLRDKVPREVKETSSLTITPWFESKDRKTVLKKLRDDLTLECGARGYPLKVEWKFKSEKNETVKPCINSSTDERYKVSRSGPHDPYSLTITGLSKADLGVYYCCLPSGCSEKINEDQCQSFEIDKKVTPWFESKDKKTVAKKLGDDLTLECGARGYPLKVEWKFKSETDETVKPCINSSTDDRYKVSQKGPHDPYSLTITSLSKADLGVYYCCLPSGCSKNVNEDQCQSFEIDEKGEPTAGTMSVVAHNVFLISGFFVLSLLRL
ncbi:lachesin-like isoform X2 [Pocillopora verrucosa]|uniref:lachesin-like isoform X2 n=1 Tax=Pocillopora verrucosa TaxID=203993 RepID=UPI003342BC0D